MRVFEFNAFYVQQPCARFYASRNEWCISTSFQAGDRSRRSHTASHVDKGKGTLWAVVASTTQRSPDDVYDVYPSVPVGKAVSFGTRCFLWDHHSVTAAPRLIGSSSQSICVPVPLQIWTLHESPLVRILDRSTMFISFSFSCTWSGDRVECCATERPPAARANLSTRVTALTNGTVVTRYQRRSVEEKGFLKALIKELNNVLLTYLSLSVAVTVRKKNDVDF
jgi:hypothetical protein